MRLRVFIFVLLNYFNRTGSNLDLRLCAEVVASVRRLYNSECVFLLYSPGLQNFRLLEEFNKQLGYFHFEASTVTFQMLNFSTLNSQCRFIHPLCILLFKDQSLINSLKATSSLDLANSKWLLFLEPGLEIEDVLADIYIPFNCQFLVAQQQSGFVDLIEVYRVGPNLPLQTYDFGKWTNRGLDSPQISFYERRNSLKGLVIKVGYFNSGAFYIQNSEEGNSLEPEGFFGEVWTTLGKQINFTTMYYKSSEPSFGSIENGTWNGLIGMVMRNEVHIGIQALTVTLERSKVVDFTMPLLRSSLSMFIRNPGRNVFRWDNFLMPFSKQLWIGVFICMILLTVSLSGIYYVKLRLGHEDNDVKFDLGQSLDYIYTSFCQQGCSVTPSSYSCRVVCLVTKLTATILLAGYSAYLVSHLAVHEEKFPFNNFQTLLADGTYTLGIIANSFLVMFFNGSGNPLLNAMYEKLIAHDELPLTGYDGLQRVCNDKKYTFITVYHTVLNEIKYVNCQIAIPWMSRGRRELAIAIAKDSPYRGIINHNLNNMRHTGVLRRLRNKWWPDDLPKEKKPWSSVPIDAIAPIMFIPAFGILAGILIMSGEFFAKRISSSIHRRLNKEESYTQEESQRNIMQAEAFQDKINN